MGIVELPQVRGARREIAVGKHAVDTSAEPAGHRNEVTLVGRLSGEPQERTLPSGDVLLSWRLVVARPPAEVPGRATVDTLDCATFRGDCRRHAGRWTAGDTVEVTGALRRRFWRTPSGAASRVEVEVNAARRLLRAVP